MKRVVLLFLIFISFNVFGVRYQITYLVGRAEYNTIKDDKYKNLLVNEIIENVKTIRTGKASYVKIISSDNKKFFIYPESTIDLSNSEYSTLYAGETEFNVEKNYRVKTLSLVVGVRGTIFKVSVYGNIYKSVVYDGSIQINDLNNTGSFVLTKGQKFEWNSTYSFKDAKVSNATLEDLEFKIDKLDPKLSYLGPESDPSKEGSSVLLSDKENKGEDELKVAEEKKEEEQEVKIEEKSEDDIIKEDIKRPDQSFEKIKKEKIFNLSVGLGSISKDNYFYKTLFFKTFIKIRNNIKVEFFIPFILDGRYPLYNIKKWGNYDEWNFSGFSDIANDTVLKLSYFEFNERSDLFYLRLGEISDVVIGNGFMVNMFNNTISIFDRKVGAEAVIDNGNFGVESFWDNITDPQIIFVNMFLRPFYGVPFMGRFKVGLEIDVDKNPTGDFNNPAYFYIGINSVIPVSYSELFSLDILLDLGKQGLYFRKWDTRPTDWADGFDFAHFHLFDNYAASLGFSGYVSRYITYKMYYSYLHSGFVDSYFDRMYYKSNINNLNYLIEPGKGDEHSVKLNLGFVMPKVFKIESGCGLYLKRKENNNVFINIKTTDLYGFFIDGFYYTLIKGFNLSNYDDNSVFSFGLTYMISPSAYITFKKFWVFDRNGDKESRVMLITYVSF